MRAALRDSVAAEAQTAATLEAELAALQAALHSEAAVAPGADDATTDGGRSELASLAAAAAASRDTANELEDACAAQRMELARLEDECGRADRYIEAQARRAPHACVADASVAARR